MKILKRLLIAVLLLGVIFLVLAAFAPKELSLSKSIIVNAPQSAAFDAVNELTNWEHWSPWLEMDTTIKNIYNEQTSGKGAFVSWTSEENGGGTMTISEVYNMDSLVTSLDFGSQGTATANFYFKRTDEGTEVTWNFHNGMSYPMNVMPWVFGAEGIISDAYESGLANLKKHVEENYKAPANLSIKKTDFTAKHYLSKRAVVKFSDLGTHFQTTMPAIAAAFLENTVKMAGPISAVFYKWDVENEETDVAIGIEADPNATIDGLTGIDVAAGQALQIDYYGPYEGTGAAHEAMAVYMETNGIKSENVSVLERYITDPSTEPDPANWLTEVIYVLGE